MAPPPLIPFNSNFRELDGRRLARLFCFFLNFSYIFAVYSDSYIVNICGILIFKITIIQWRIRLSQFLWEFIFLISIRVNFCDCVMWVFIDQPDVPLCLLDHMLHHLGILLFIDDFITG